MLKDNLLLLLVAVSSLPVFSQNFEFGLSISGESTQQSEAMAVDPQDGSIYLTGFFFQEIDADPGTAEEITLANELSDAYLIKLDNEGNYLWMHHFADTAFETGLDVCVDEEGNVLALVDKGSRAGVYKLSSDGDSIWDYEIISTESLSPRSIALDTEGNIVLTGSYSGEVDFDPTSSDEILTSEGVSHGFVLKINESGSFDWVKQFYGEDETLPQSVDLDASDNIYISGSYTGATNLDPLGSSEGEYSAQGLTDFFVLKLSATGIHEWSKSIGGSSTDECEKVVIDQDGNCYLTGFFSLEVDFDPSSGEDLADSEGGFDAFVMKFDSDGEYLWSNQFGGPSYDFGLGLDVDPYKNVYICGQFLGVVDFDSGDDEFFMDTGGSSETYVLKVNENGEFLWALRLVSEGFGNSVSDLQTTEEGDVFVTGAFGNDIDLDPSEDDFVLSTTDFLDDIYLLKLNQEHAGIESLSEMNEGLLLYPNPSNGTFYLDLSGESRIEVYAMDGRHIDSFMSNESNQYSLPSLKSGQYTLVLTNGVERKRVKLFIK